MYGFLKKCTDFVKKNVRIVRIFFRKLYGLYGFFFENCTDCTDFCTDSFKKVCATLNLSSKDFFRATPGPSASCFIHRYKEKIFFYFQLFIFWVFSLKSFIYKFFLRILHFLDNRRNFLIFVYIFQFQTFLFLLFKVFFCECYNSEFHQFTIFTLYGITLFSARTFRI